MKKYIATIENLIEETTFKVLFDPKTGILTTNTGEEIYDMSEWDDSGEKITHFSNKEIIETVYALYGKGLGWEITDCIEYEDPK